MTTGGVNPKQAYGEAKLPLQLIPPIAEIELAKGLAEGARKYGAYNWRENPIDPATYVGAIRRHLQAWAAGQRFDRKSGVHHLGHIMANCAILMDAEMSGSIEDLDLTGADVVLKALDDYEQERLTKAT